MGDNSDIDFLIVCSGYNCARYVKKCYASIVGQTYKNFQAILIDDGSEQFTKTYISNIKNHDDRIRIFLSDTNMGAAYRRFQAINNLAEGISDNTVIVLLGMDDELLPEALEVVAQEYRSGKLVTYGNWQGNNGFKLAPGFLTFPPEVHKTRGYRKERYRSTAPNTFKKLLFNKFIEQDFKFNGEWIKATTESNLMISCLEMAGEHRIGVIEKSIYLYNKDRSDSARNRFGSKYQDEIYLDVVSKPKRKLI